MFIVYKIPRKLLVTGSILLLAIVAFSGANNTGVNPIPEPVEQIETQESLIALTINVDWGEEYIPRILDILEKRGAKVTFFVTGRWAKKNPELLREMAQRGHQIENHGYSHPHPDKISVQANIQELKKTEEVIAQIIGYKTQFYAPPYGERGASGLKAASQINYTTIFWTLDTVDWKPGSTPELIAQRILSPTRKSGRIPNLKGSIVLMHPKENTLKALPIILENLNKRGFKAITLSELITLANHGNTTS